ncbi:MAG: efflux RND transporter periplasmic adaptor subunit, partial [Acidobacteria bacterium]|nr:efflux RND transporter periplasmic adaptor subunit [Acidobacteriota bacterium]NIQ86965.1 efflux RND transporter periplasmic adaptor subunit [Acidobacteriota bacterium]
GFELPGEIEAVLYDEGELIEAGAVVARLDTSILQAEKAALVAARDQARAATELAAITRRRMRDALEREAAS